MNCYICPIIAPKYANGEIEILISAWIDWDCGLVCLRAIVGLVKVQR